MPNERTPGSIVKDILIGLATNDFEGIRVDQFWFFVESLVGNLDEFMKNVVWSWLLKEADFEVLRKIGDSKQSPNDAETSSPRKKSKAGEVIENKLALPDYQTFFNGTNTSEYIVKVTDDFQSLYLAGVPKKDNILGKMPYDLLRIIAKHKKMGINSIDLIKESNQDKRSLTTRLQVLEDNLLIIKCPVSVNRCYTNHMVHFRFSGPDRNSTIPEESTSDFYDRFQVMEYIINALKKEKSGIRLTQDLFEEVKQTQPILKLRWFNVIIKFLVENGFIELIQVELTELNRLFPAVRFLKDLPPVNKKSEFLEEIRQQSMNEAATNPNGGDENTDETIDQPHFNRFFPLATQVYNTIEKNPGITSAAIETELTGVYRAKQISVIIDSMATITPDPSNPSAVVGQMVQTGKSKFYRFTVQNLLNRRDPHFKFQTPQSENINEAAERTLLEKSMEYGKSYSVEKKLKFISLTDNENDKEKLFIIPKGYNGSLGSKLASAVPSRIFISEKISSRNGWVKINAKKGTDDEVIKDIESYQKIYEISKENAELHNKTINMMQTDLDKLRHVNNAKGNKMNSTDSQHSEETPVTKNKNTHNRSQIPLDFGPAYRRKQIQLWTDEKKCLWINTDFSLKISSYLKLDYKIDRRTLINDARYLASKKLIDFVQLDKGKHVTKSLVNPPSEKDIEEAIADVFSKGVRKYTDKVKLDVVPLHSNMKLTAGEKMNKALRLKNAVKKLNTATNRNRLSTKNEYPHNKSLDEDDENENSDEDSDSKYDDHDLGEEENFSSARIGKRKDTHGRRTGKVKSIEDDLFEPLMDDRKRKKLKSSNKSQVRVAKAFKKIRTSIKITNDHILILIKAIIITQSLSTSGNIDWPKVSKVLDDIYSPDTLRRQWPRHKKMLGPRNLLSARRNWESALLNAISSGIITSNDLEDYDLFRMLDTWKGEGADIFINKSDNEILDKYEDNFDHQTFKPLREELGPEIFKDAVTIIEKEHMWTSRNFMYSINDDKYRDFLNECEHPTLLQVAKTKLKALFATQQEKFDSSKVRQLFADIPKELYSEALTQLEDKKAIAFLGEDSKIKFTLTDRLVLTLECKLDDEFINNAKRMVEIFNEDLNKGFLLSTRCPSGSYAPILTLFSENKLTVTRVDQKMNTLNTYYTKSLDRSKLESDFIISHYKKDEAIVAKKIIEPIDSPCSYLWIDLAGDFNEKLWRKCLYVLLWSVVFNPGTPLNILSARIYPLLEPFEVKKIMDWLVMRGNVRHGNHGGYWPTECWYDIK